MIGKKDPPPPAAGTPEKADTFTEEILAVVPDQPNWAPMTGEVQAIGTPPERYDLIPHDPLVDLAILFGKREDEEATPIALHNHAVSSLVSAAIVSGPTRKHHLIEAARACLVLADRVK